MTTNGEQTAQDHLELLKEILDAGEDPRKVQHAALRIELDGNPTQRRQLDRIKERAAAKHDRRAGQGKPRKRTLVEQANSSYLGDDDDSWLGLDS